MNFPSPRLFVSSFEVMDQNFENDELGECDNNIKAPISVTKHSKMSNECNQCGFASVYESALKMHMKTHSGEKSNKCNQCDCAV